MDLGAIIRVAAPFLSGVFGAVAAAFVVLLLTKARRLEEVSEPPVVDGRQLSSQTPETRRKAKGRTSHLLRKFVEYAGNVSLTS